MVFRRRVQFSRTATIALQAAALAIAVGGCASMKSAPPAYDLFAAHTFPHRAGASRGQLIVSEPTALSILDTEKIMVRPVTGETQQMANAQWEDRLPRLIQSRLVQSFENANRLRAIGKPGDRLASDFLLVTDVRAFEIAAETGTAEVQISAKIVRESSGRILAARVFAVSIPAAATQGQPAVAALNEAFVKVAMQVVLWAARLV